MNSYWRGLRALWSPAHSGYGPPFDLAGGRRSTFAGNPTRGTSGTHQAVVYDGTDDESQTSNFRCGTATHYTFAWIGELNTGWSDFDTIIGMRNATTPATNLMIRSSGGNPVVGFTHNDNSATWGWTGGPSVNLNQYSVFAVGSGGDVPGNDHFWAVAIDRDGFKSADHGGSNTTELTWLNPYLADDPGFGRNPPCRLVTAGMWARPLSKSELVGLYVNPQAPAKRKRRRRRYKAPAAATTPHGPLGLPLQGPFAGPFG